VGYTTEEVCLEFPVFIPAMPRAASKKYIVFISHSGKDMWVAKQIAREVQARLL
jgi:hypothetical protein